MLNTLRPRRVIFFTMRRYASAAYAVVVCPSVSPSATNRSSAKMAKRRVTQTTPLLQLHRDSSSFLTPKILIQFEWGHLQREADSWGRLKSAVFDQCLAISHKRCKIRT